MTALIKYWLLISFFVLSSLFFASRAFPDNLFSKHSAAYEKNKAPQGDLEELFRQLGAVYPMRGNPCFDLEEYTRKWCTPHALSLLLSERIFVPVEDQLIRKFLQDRHSSCDHTALYIGRVCALENFKKIFKHFAIKEGK